MTFVSVYNVEQAIAYEYNSDFSRQLAQRMDFWSNDPQADAIGRVRNEQIHML
jgi:vesicle-associated membrane protein 7